MVANRAVRTGLTTSAVISSWTFTSALLGAPYLTYLHGVALPVWWSNGQSVMICCFAYLAIQAKLKAPNAHTLLEVIKVRHGKTAHLLWTVMALLNNIFNFAEMLVGASSSVASLTGMNVYAATFLLPTGVVIYTYWGGLRATFLTDYIHTFIIMIIVVWFSIKVVVAAEISSIGQLYDSIKRLPSEGSVEGNYEGSYLTMTSDQSVFFGIIHIVTNFGIVIMDTGFWQKGFSADVAAAVPGYILGGNAYFGIPWALGTIVGLGKSIDFDVKRKYSTDRRQDLLFWSKPRLGRRTLADSQRQKLGRAWFSRTLLQLLQVQVARQPSCLFSSWHVQVSRLLSSSP